MTSFFRKLSWWARRRSREAELEEEIRFHLEEETGQRQAEGLPQNEAHQAARRDLGNIGRVQEDTRATWGWTWVERLLQDLRYALRNMRKAPGFTATAAVSLALGIGACTAIFTVVNSVLLRPLPYPEPGRLVRLWETNPKQGFARNVVNPWNFLDWRERTHSFEGVAAFQSGPANLAGQGEPVAVPAMQVSPAFFSILGVAPLIGRTFTADEETPGRERSVVLSYGLWQTRFGGDRAALGKRILLFSAPATIVGVMPATFSWPDSKPELWVPLPLDRDPGGRSGRFLQVVGRMKPGVDVKRADQELKNVAAQLAGQDPDLDKGWSAEVIPMLQDTTHSVRTALLVLLAAVGFLLLIACANVANLFLMRSSDRASEIALREALGAPRLRIFRQFLTESLVVSLLAAAIGVVAGYAGMQAMLALLPESVALPRMGSIGLDGRVLAVAIAASVLTAVLFGLVPMIHSGRLASRSAFRTRARSASNRLRRVFVSVQIALALVLLIGAGLLTRSFARLISVQPGFAIEHELAMGMFPSPIILNPRERSQYFEKILAEIRNVPGVEAASSIHFLPLEENFSGSCFSPPTDPLPPPTAQPGAQFLVVGPGYFTTTGLRIEDGREFTDRDRFGTPSAIIVNRAFVRRYYPGENPIGKKLVVCWTLPNPAVIVGIAGDARQTELGAAPEPTIFVPNLQAPSFFATLVIRTRTEPDQLAQAVVAAIHRVNSNQAVSNVRTLKQVFNDSVGRPRFQVLLMLIFAGVALLLAAIGVYGVVSYSVAQRTPEIGIRVAVGATRGDIARLVLQEGLLLAAIGAGAGLAGALVMNRFLRALLYETAPTDSTVFAAACGLLLVVAAIAIAIPLRRATRVDPIAALRHE